LAAELSQDAGFEFLCLVDSAAAVEFMDGCLSDAGFQGSLPVLLELGAEGGRCGCRSAEEALALAERIRAARHLTLAGVETYENVFPDQSQAAALRLVDQLLDRVRDLVTQLDAAGHFAGREEILVTAGGSQYFDRVISRLGSSWSCSGPVRVILRSGSYVTSDLGLHGRTPQLGGPGEGEVGFRQALELWALVFSRPEPELAILGFGKRDAAYDRGLPVPFAKVGTAGLESLPPGELEVLALNDQHAHVRVRPPSRIGVGDLVGMHISHPCTSFDKFRLIPLVDDRYRVTGAIRSYL
jgi:D-serine dehydratase